VQTQKVPFGVDPKTVLCQFFKAGQCQKGDKCKFSHDLAVERKSAKIDLYTDSRTIGDKKTGMMCKWKVKGKGRKRERERVLLNIDFAMGNSKQIQWINGIRKSWRRL